MARHRTDLMRRMVTDDRIVRYGTILPTEGTLMDEHHESVRKNFQQFTYKYDITDKEAAKGIGYAPSTLSSWRNGKYGGQHGGDLDKLTRQVNKWMEREARKRDVRLELPYMPTDIAEDMRAVVHTACEHVRMAAIVAPAGCGKSMVAKVLAEDLNGFYMYADEDVTVKSFLERLVKLTGAQVDGGTIDSLKSAVINKLLRSGRPIIIDEAHLLRPAVFSRLRSIYDQAEVPIVMFGAYEILARVDDRSTGRGQMARRTIQWNALEVFANVEDPSGGDQIGKPLYKVEQVKALFAHMPVKLTKSGLEMLWAIACLPNRGCLDTAKLVLDIAYRHFGDKKQIGLDEIEAILDGLFRTRAGIVIARAKEHRQKFLQAAA
ncbi:MAG: ATP-binding protein [Planctomycetota bacterium]